MDLRLSAIADVVSGKLIGTGDPRVDDIYIDTRKPAPTNGLFIALKGPRFDAHQFVEDAVENGAVAGLVSEADRIETDAPLIEVEDTTRALQHLAKWWRQQFNMPIIGITGSNGKTIVKEMLAGILGREYTIHRSPRSFNSQIGVPLSLLGLRQQHDLAIIEAGISETGEMDLLAEMIDPDYGILTNIGSAHARGLGDLETTAEEKLKLFKKLESDGWLIRPSELHPLKDATFFDVAEPQRVPDNNRTFDVEPTQSDIDYRVESIDKKPGTFGFDFESGSVTLEDLSLNVPGRHNLYNAAAAVAAALEIGVSEESIRTGLAAFELSPMRLELHTTDDGVTLINDAYSSDPVSARAALKTLNQYRGAGRSIAIFGDMRDLGDMTERAHRRLGRIIARADIDHLICHGEYIEKTGRVAIDSGFDAESVEFTETIDELHRATEDIVRPDDVVLFKASRRVGLERAAERLLRSLAPGRLQVDLSQVRDNYRVIREHLDDQTKFMAVVKGSGYGNNSSRISQTLIQEGVDALAVAYPDEAIPLRQKGIELPILVLNTSPYEIDKISRYDLTPLISSQKLLDTIRDEVENRDEPLSVHLQVNTGMNRIGVCPSETPKVAQDICDADELHFEGLITHFAAADVPEHDEFTNRQLNAFQEVVQTLEKQDIQPDIVHAANTSATWRFPESHFDMVRVGLGLYGLLPNPRLNRKLSLPHELALRFTTKIIHLHTVKQGETVSYGRTWEAPGDREVAVIAVGYNDGFPRFMSNGGEVLIDGTRCPVVGNVCMDVAMVDVSDVDGVGIGDEVVIFGQQGDEYIHIDEVAERGDTISYEIMCNISDRIQRVFVEQ